MTRERFIELAEKTVELDALDLIEFLVYKTRKDGFKAFWFSFEDDRPCLVVQNVLPEGVRRGSAEAREIINQYVIVLSELPESVSAYA